MAIIFFKKYENKSIDKILLEELLYSLTSNFILLPSAFLSLATDFWFQATEMNNT